MKTAKAYIGLIIVFILWGSLYVVSSLVLESMPPFMVMLCRFAIAFAALSAIVAAKRRKWRCEPEHTHKKTRLDRKGWKYVILLGVLGYAVSVSAQLIGTKYAGSTMASLINALNPVTISLMAVPILHEKMTWNKALGIALAVAGVYMILGFGGNVNAAGVVFSILSVLGWSLVSVLTRQDLSEYEPLVTTKNALGIAAVCEAVFTVAEHFVSAQPVHISLPVIIGLLYLGIICTGLTYILWNEALAQLPASNCSALYPVQPLTSTVMGIMLFGDKIGISFVTGTLMIIAGVLICLLVQPRAEKAQNNMR